MEHNLHYQSTIQRFQGTSDVGPSPRYLRSRVDGLFAGGASEAAEKPAGVERGNRFTGGTERPEALLFLWFVPGRHFCCSERYALLLNITTGRRIACSEDSGVVRPLVGTFALPLLRSCCCSVRHVSLLCVVDLWNERHIGLPSPPAFFFQRPNGVERVVC